MKQLVKVLCSEIISQVKLFQSNIIRIEGIDTPLIYQEVCKKINSENCIDVFVPKITMEKFLELKKAEKQEWVQALSYLHRGYNSVYSEVISAEYADASFVDFNNAITKWRNESANIIGEKTTLILLMGTEAAQDTGGLADTSFVISPRELIANLSKDYSVWFSDVIENNNIYEDYHKAIHTVYKTLFSHISTDIFKLSDFIDGLFELSFSSVQELVGHICETLNNTWNIPSIVDKKAVPKVSALNKGGNSAKIITSAVKFIERLDDIPTTAALIRMHEKFSKYASDQGIDVNKPFPENHSLFSNYAEFEGTVVDFMQGIKLDSNREKLLQVDYAVISTIMGTKLPQRPKERVKTYLGTPVEAYSQSFLDTVKSFFMSYGVYPTKIQLRLSKILMSDCTEDQKKESFMNVCNFLGGILGFFNELKIEVDRQILTFEYEETECSDPFNFANYDLVNSKIKSTGKWGEPCKIQFDITATNGDKAHKYEFKWAFSPYAPWLNAFSYLADVLYSAGTSYNLPTMVSCSNMQEYLECESEDEFYAHLQQFRGQSLYDEHKCIIREYYTSPIIEHFNLVCNNFKNFAVKLTQNGFFYAEAELRILVKSYTDFLRIVQDNYAHFTDVQKEQISFLINIFMITSNADILNNGDMKDVIIPAYNPVMLEKIDAQQLFLRRGFREILCNLMMGDVKDSVIKAKYDNLIQLSSITQAADIVRRKSNVYLTCKNMWEYFGVYYDQNKENTLLESSAVGLSIVTDDEDAAAMIQNTPMSNIIVRNIRDYIRTFPARIDGLNVAFIAPQNMQHIVAAIRLITKAFDKENCSAAINIKIICINSKKNFAAYLRRWLDSYFSEEKVVKVNTYLHNCTVESKADIEELDTLLTNYDLCFTYNILQSGSVQFDLSTLSTDETADMNYEKFPMTFTPDMISALPGKSRRVNISQFQFLAAKQHTQISHMVGNPHNVEGIFRAYRTLELPEIQKAILDIAHNCCKWVVCIDQAIDRHMLEATDSKIIGFTTGEGSYGELNVTVSARKDILKDIKQMLQRRITEKFVNWDTARLQKAAEYCVDELSKFMDGSRILKALNPYDYEIHSFLAYILTLQMLGLTKKDDRFIVRVLISLDSYKHWFAEDDEINQDNKRPDFMLIEIPYDEENITPGTELKIHVKIIECKMGFQNENHIEKARTQLEKGIRTMSMNWRPEVSGVMHRYWFNQLYRAIIFSPLSRNIIGDEYGIVRDKIYDILKGKYKIDWTGDIFAFWLDVNDETPDVYEIHSNIQNELAVNGIKVGNIMCHNCGQMFIQKMLLPEGERDSQFYYNNIVRLEDETESEELDDSENTVTSELSGTGATIPKPKDIYVPFIHFLADGEEHSRIESLEWYCRYFSISEQDKKLVYESNGHLKYETVFDSIITEFRKKLLLENNAVGTFHITELGRTVNCMIEDGADITSFAALVKIAKTGEEDNGLSGEAEEVSTEGITALEDIRVLLGRDRRNLPVYWEFGHTKLANRHILITGISGQGKTYAIQTMILELVRQNISSVVFDYTDGFLPGKLEPEFEVELDGKITQEVAILNRIPVNPFRLQMIEIPPFGSVPEKATTVAGRISDILKHVYSFGDQQAASIYVACKQGIDQFGKDMDFSKLRQILEEMGTPQAKSVLAKMAQFFDTDLFDSSREFNWKDIIQGSGKVKVIQLTGLDRELQTIVTEIMMWDAWYSLTKFGNKNKPFVVVLDEAQNLSFKEKSPAEKILREGRKYGWSAWFATQFLKGTLDSGEISNLQQAAERLYFKPTGEEMSYIAEQIADTKAETADWLNVIKGIQKGQCIVQGDRIKQNGQFGAVKPVLINISSFRERQ